MPGQYYNPVLPIEDGPLPTYMSTSNDQSFEFISGPSINVSFSWASIVILHYCISMGYNIAVRSFIFKQTKCDFSGLPLPSWVLYMYSWRGQLKNWGSKGNQLSRHRQQGAQDANLLEKGDKLATPSEHPSSLPRGSWQSPAYARGPR